MRLFRVRESRFPRHFFFRISLSNTNRRHDTLIKSEKIVSFQLAPDLIFSIITCTSSWAVRMKWGKTIGKKVKFFLFHALRRRRNIRCCWATTNDFSWKLTNTKCWNVQSIELSKSYQNQQPLRWRKEWINFLYEEICVDIKSKGNTPPHFSEHRRGMQKRHDKKNELLFIIHWKQAEQGVARK